MRSIGGDCLLGNDFALQTFFVENALMILESIQEELIFSVAKKVVVHILVIVVVIISREDFFVGVIMFLIR